MCELVSCDYTLKMHLVFIYGRKQLCDETPRDDGDDACFRNGRWRNEEEDTTMWAPVGACTSDSDKLVKLACVCDKMHNQKIIYSELHAKVMLLLPRCSETLASDYEALCQKQQQQRKFTAVCRLDNNDNQTLFYIPYFGLFLSLYKSTTSLHT